MYAIPVLPDAIAPENVAGELVGILYPKWLVVVGAAPNGYAIRVAVKKEYA